MVILSFHNLLRAYALLTIGLRLGNSAVQRENGKLGYCRIPEMST